jgi:hypothetical protein
VSAAEVDTGIRTKEPTRDPGLRSSAIKRRRFSTMKNTARAGRRLFSI